MPTTKLRGMCPPQDQKQADVGAQPRHTRPAWREHLLRKKRRRATACGGIRERRSPPNDQHTLGAERSGRYAPGESQGPGASSEGAGMSGLRDCRAPHRGESPGTEQNRDSGDEKDEVI